MKDHHKWVKNSQILLLNCQHWNLPKLVAMLKGLVMSPSFHNINMGQNPWLIFYSGHFITRNRKELGLLHCQTSRSKHKIMHGFSHALTNSVSSVFLIIVWHFEEIKKLLTTFDICHGSPLFQQIEDCDKLHKLPLVFYRVPIRNLLSHRNLPRKNNILSFILTRLARQVDVIPIDNHPGHVYIYYSNLHVSHQA
jgi:hypothetical protein